MRRLWQRDASLWTGTDEANWLGWLGITEEQIAHGDNLAVAWPRSEAEGSPTFFCSAWVDPAFARKCWRKPLATSPAFRSCMCSTPLIRRRSRLSRARSISAKTCSWSPANRASTLEPNIFKQYFFERVKQAVGAEKAGSHFIAITDPGSKMQQVAEADHFRHIFYGDPSIGGRYSALSNFGMVPAALMGLDTAKFLDRTEEMVEACAPSVPVHENPGCSAGNYLGHGSQEWPRQSHDHCFTRHFRSRRVARAVAGRIHRKAGQRHHSGGSRGVGTARCLRQRSHLCLCASGLSA